MPIIDGSVQYTIPDEIKIMITPEFCNQFLKELHCVFGVSIEDADLDYFVYQGGTAGWAAAFANACRKLDKDELYKYYLRLEWFDSDCFDGELEDLLVEYKLILKNFLSDEIARQNNLSTEDVTFCDKCGKFFKKSELLENSIDMDESEPYIEYICKTCKDGEAATDLPWSIERAVTETLKKSKDDFFICKKCGKAHWVNHKGNQYCLNCEIEKISQNCNVYYQESLNLNKEYKRKVLNK